MKSLSVGRVAPWALAALVFTCIHSPAWANNRASHVHKTQSKVTDARTPLSVLFNIPSAGIQVVAGSAKAAVDVTAGVGRAVGAGAAALAGPLLAGPRRLLSGAPTEPTGTALLLNRSRFSKGWFKPQNDCEDWQVIFGSSTMIC